MRKVAILVPSISRVGAGVAESARLCAWTLSRSDWEVSVYSFADEFSCDAISSWPKAKIVLYKSKSNKFQFSLRFFIDVMLHDFDRIHAHGLWTFHCLALTFRMLFKPVFLIITPHGMLEKWILRRSAFAKSVMSWAFQRHLVRAATVIQALTEAEVKDIAAYCGRADARVCPNYLDDTPVPEFVRPTWWKSDYVGRRTYLFLGRLHEKKGVFELIAAWKEAFKGDSTGPLLVVCGWAESKEYLDYLLKHASSRSDIVFAGGVAGDEKKFTLVSSDFFVLPSKSEGLPMTVIEAWRSGIPALISTHCNLDFSLKLGGALNIGTETVAIRDRLIQINQMDDAERRDRSRLARQTYERYFSPTIVEPKILELYDLFPSFWGAEAYA